jgi:hypothetical protein
VLLSASESVIVIVISPRSAVLTWVRCVGPSALTLTRPVRAAKKETDGLDLHQPTHERSASEGLQVAHRRGRERQVEGTDRHDLPGGRVRDGEPWLW